LYALSGQIAALAIRHRVPTSFQFRRGVAAGGLMSYGANAFEMFRMAGAYTGRILKGDKPGDLPVPAVDKIRVCDQLENGQGAGNRGAARAAIDRRRGNRIKDENLEDLR